VTIKLHSVLELGFKLHLETVPKHLLGLIVTSLIARNRNRVSMEQPSSCISTVSPLLVCVSVNRRGLIGERRKGLGEEIKRILPMVG
jgi:hypothetical protein